MKEKIKFNLDLYKTGKYDVVTRGGKPVEIRFTDGYNPYPIVGYIEHDSIKSWHKNGVYILGQEHHFDLFLVEKGLAIAVTEENNPYKQD